MCFGALSVILMLNSTLCCLVKNILGYSTKCCSYCFRNFKVLRRITDLFFGMYFLYRKMYFLCSFFSIPIQKSNFRARFPEELSSQDSTDVNVSCSCSAPLQMRLESIYENSELQTVKLFQPKEFFYIRYNFFFLDEHSDFFPFFFFICVVYCELSNNSWRDFWIFCQIILKLPDMF